MVRPKFLSAASLVASLLATAALCTEPPVETPADPAPPLFLGDAYPLEVPVSFPAALLHWLDSLAHLRGAGLTAGKTTQAHRQAYIDDLGVPSEEDQRSMEAYHGVRVRFANSATRDRNGLTRAFFEARDLDDALERAGSLLDEKDQAALNETVRRFATGYQQIWKNGEVPRSFVKRVEASEQRDELARFLAGVAGFFDVDPGAAPRPRLILAPVPPDVGTHAQAIDEFLLLEVRLGDGLRQQVAPIVHENAHLLFQRMGPERIKALEGAALAHGTSGQAAWQHLKEALPTAIAQGVAQVTFGVQGWSFEARWYDVETVDVFAKKIFPNVKRALSTGRKLDPVLIDEFVEIYAGAVATPR